MFRKTWRHVRLLGRLTAWSAGSLGCLFALYHAASRARGLMAPYTGELSQTHILFGWLFCPLSILVLIWVWPSFVRRSLSIDSSWLKILRTFVAVLICLVGAGLGTAVATDQYGPLWTWVLLAAAAGSLICLVIPRLVFSFLRPNVFSRDVLSLNLKLRAVVAARCVIGIGLVGVLAIPNFLRFSSRARTDEVKLNLGAIRAAEQAYFNEFGTYVAADPHPKKTSGSAGAPWRQREGETVRGFDLLGWEPGADVYCRYGVAVRYRRGRATAFTAEAICDFDGDGVHSSWGYIEPAPGFSIGIPGPFAACPSIGAYDRESGQYRLRWLGPCDEKSGQTIF